MAKTPISKPIAEENKTPIAKAVKVAAAAKTAVVQPAELPAPVKPQAKSAPAEVAETAAEKPKDGAKKVPKAATETKEKPKKPKLVRDSFTMPEAEYAVLTEMKKACLKDGVEVKKSELLRVGVALLKKLDTAGIKEILAGLPSLKAGRPKKGK